MVSLERLYVDTILLGMGRCGHDGGCRGKVEQRWAAMEDMGEGTAATGADADGDGGGKRRWAAGAATRGAIVDGDGRWQG
jgi:hypothetical protein